MSVSFSSILNNLIDTERLQVQTNWLPMTYVNMEQSFQVTLFTMDAQPELAHADCAVSGSCDAKVVLAEQLPAKFRVYTLVVCPFVGCPVPLKVAF